MSEKNEKLNQNEERNYNYCYSVMYCRLSLHLLSFNSVELVLDSISYCVFRISIFLFSLIIFNVQTSIYLPTSLPCLVFLSYQLLFMQLFSIIFIIIIIIIIIVY